MAFTDNTIHVCVFCGERCTGKYCKTCGTKGGRDELIKEQAKINKENKAKGHNVPNYAFGGKVVYAK